MNENPLSHILEYNLDLGKTKPDTVHRDEKYCPFCDVAHLKNVMEKRGPMIWLENAYPVLKDSWQTLIIESDDCDGEFSSYTPEYALKLIQFGLEKWQQVKDMGKFRSVVFYRNHGYMSGGTIHHPHSQIVGFKDYDYHQDIKPFHFVGPAIVGRRPDGQLVPAPHHRFLRSEPHPQGPGKAGEIRPLYAADGRLFHALLCQLQRQL